MQRGKYRYFFNLTNVFIHIRYQLDLTQINKQAVTRGYLSDTYICRQKIYRQRRKYIYDSDFFFEYFGNLEINCRFKDYWSFGGLLEILC